MYYEAAPGSPGAAAAKKPGKAVYAEGTTRYKGVNSKFGQKAICLNTCTKVGGHLEKSCILGFQAINAAALAFDLTAVPQQPKG